MATFNPDIPLDYATDLPLAGSKVPVVMQDLSTHTESFTNDEKVLGGSIVMRFLTLAEKDEVMLFYETNKNLDWTFANPHDGNNYTLKFISPPPTPRLESTAVDSYSITLSVRGDKL